MPQRNAQSNGQCHQLLYLLPSQLCTPQQHHVIWILASEHSLYKANTAATAGWKEVPFFETLLHMQDCNLSHSSFSAEGSLSGPPSCKHSGIIATSGAESCCPMLCNIAPQVSLPAGTHALPPRIIACNHSTEAGAGALHGAPICSRSRSMRMTLRCSWLRSCCASSLSCISALHRDLSASTSVSLAQTCSFQKHCKGPVTLTLDPQSIQP